MTIKKTTPKPELTEAELVRALRGERSFRNFETYLNESIPDGMPGKTTFASVWNWINDVHSVNSTCLWAWETFYPTDDPRRQLAQAILKLRENGTPGVTAKDAKKLIIAVEPKKEKATL